MKIISGGQTGIDRLALDIAIENGISHGGWCPLGRRAEDGRIPGCYDLSETDTKNYAVRTRLNIVDSDGTLVLHGEQVSRGTELTKTIAASSKRPLLVIDFAEQFFDESQTAARIKTWITENRIVVLNVAGPRLSTSPQLPKRARPVLEDVFRDF